MSSSASSLPPDVDARLDQILAGWAKVHQITAPRAEAIRREILETARYPGYEWRREWSESLSSLVSVRATAFPPVLATVHQTLATVIPGWPMPNFKPGGDYRLYLQVT